MKRNIFLISKLLKIGFLSLIGLIVLLVALGWAHAEWEQYHAYALVKEILSTVSRDQDDKQLEKVLLLHGFAFSERVISDNATMTNLGISNIVEQRCFSSSGCDQYSGNTPGKSDVSCSRKMQYSCAPRVPSAYEMFTAIGAGGELFCSRHYALIFVHSYITHHIQFYVWGEQFSCL